MECGLAAAQSEPGQTWLKERPSWRVVPTALLQSVRLQATHTAALEWEILRVDCVVAQAAAKAATATAKAATATAEAKAAAKLMAVAARQTGMAAAMKPRPLHRARCVLLQMSSPK